MLSLIFQFDLLKFTEKMQFCPSRNQDCKNMNSLVLRGTRTARIWIVLSYEEPGLQEYEQFCPTRNQDCKNMWIVLSYEEPGLQGYGQFCPTRNQDYKNLDTTNSVQSPLKFPPLLITLYFKFPQFINSKSSILLRHQLSQEDLFI